jgi:hypothetical protein
LFTSRKFRRLAIALSLMALRLKFDIVERRGREAVQNLRVK